MRTAPHLDIPVSTAAPGAYAPGRQTGRELFLSMPFSMEQQQRQQHVDWPGQGQSQQPRHQRQMSKEWTPISQETFSPHHYLSATTPASCTVDQRQLLAFAGLAYDEQGNHHRSRQQRFDLSGQSPGYLSSSTSPSSSSTTTTPLSTTTQSPLYTTCTSSSSSAAAPVLGGGAVMDGFEDWARMENNMLAWEPAAAQAWADMGMSIGMDMGMASVAEIASAVNMRSANNSSNNNNNNNNTSVYPSTHTSLGINMNMSMADILSAAARSDSITPQPTGSAFASTAPSPESTHSDIIYSSAAATPDAQQQHLLPTTPPSSSSATTTRARAPYGPHRSPTRSRTPSPSSAAAAAVSAPYPKEYCAGCDTRFHRYAELRRHLRSRLFVCPVDDCAGNTEVHVDGRTRFRFEVVLPGDDTSGGGGGPTRRYVSDRSDSVQRHLRVVHGLRAGETPDRNRIYSVDNPNPACPVSQGRRWRCARTPGTVQARRGGGVLRRASSDGEEQ